MQNHSWTANNVFLTLIGFSQQHILPVFRAVYGGYYVAAGAEFFVTDFAPNPDVLAFKIGVL